MAVLNEWQKITRVLPGKPFGDGVDGDYNSSTIPTMTYRSCSGTSGNKTLSIASGAYSNGDIILIHQTRGTGVGQWEINQIESGGGTTTLTLKKALQYTYTDSGASQAQVIKVFRYTNVTQSGTWTITDWDGNINGILAFAAKGTCSVGGTITANGKGYLLGLSDTEGQGYGEGTTGARGSSSTTSGGNSGGGGGHATDGGDSLVGGGTSGGSSVGSADLTTIVFGGGGGAGASANEPDGDGGDSGGMIIGFVKSLTVTGASTANGNNGEDAEAGGGGGGGSGGAQLWVVQTATLGSNKITALAGSGGDGVNTNDGANGSVGRIAVHHSGAVTGTTNPTFTDVTDPSLVEKQPGAGLLMLT